MGQALNFTGEGEMDVAFFESHMGDFSSLFTEVIYRLLNQLLWGRGTGSDAHPFYPI